jgi:predicted hotdog family 3-hydroxylacyl-ACP dehydratase
MRLDRASIERLIPHQGRMCLLDEVLAWDADRISCRARSHRDSDNPLRAGGRLGVLCGIEYAAQAMAVQGALGSGGAPPAAGLLAGVRGVQFHTLRLDEIPGDLYCDARRVAGDARTALYDFELRTDAARLLTGRATVLLDAENWK